MARAAAAVAAAAVLAVLAGAAPAHAQQTIGPGGAELTEPSDYAVPPPGRRLSGREVLRIAEATSAVREADPSAYARAYMTRDGGWQVSLFVPPTDGELRRDEVAQVLIDDRTGRVREAWTGVQVAWPMARGYAGAFGRAANDPRVWIGLCVLFLLPFARPPLRMLHLDLAVLLAFSVGYAFFGAAEIGVSIPFAYPLLAYLLVRMLQLARRPPPALPRLLVGPGFLLLGIVFLAGFRIALNVTDGNVIDVGYAGVIGADKIADGAPLYGAFPPDNPRGDTYGPVAYLAYVPFETLLPWGGTWDDLPAAHAASLAFDLGTALLLFLLGRRLHTRELGLLLAYLWMTYPFTLLVANSGANDALVPLLVTAALLAAARPAARGALIALAGLTKLAPLALAPLFVTFRGGALRAALAFAVVAAVVIAPFDPELAFERTLGFQQDRDSPFSLWGHYELPQAVQLAAQAAAALLAVVLAFVPRRRDVATLAALSAAVLIALQLTVDHWFYLYLVWFAPLTWIALLAPAAGSARSHPPAATARSG
jgi:hypothetical protein